MDCFTCQRYADPDKSPSEDIAGDQYWYVAHSFDTALPGWLVLIPKRHVTTIAELTDEEASTLGLWQVRLSRALHKVTGCTKTYVAQFAEGEGFHHVHFHLVPRPADLPAELRGPRIFFHMLGRPEQERVSQMDRDALALKLRAELQIVNQ